MKIQRFCFFILFVIIFFNSCNDDDDDNNPSMSGPEIEWISGGLTTSYTYSGGVLSGYSFRRSFTVLNESGKVTIEVKVNTDDDARISSTFNVEKGKQYALKVDAGKKSPHATNPGAKCLTVVFSSPNCSTKQEIQVNSYVVSSYNEWVGDTYYCPSSLTFGEISISE
jgi:hypothetical protein